MRDGVTTVHDIGGTCKRHSDAQVIPKSERESQSYGEEIKEQITSLFTLRCAQTLHSWSFLSAQFIGS